MASPLISLSRVDLGYDTHSVVKDFSLSIGERDFIVLRGRNGSGKSTLVKHLVGLLPQQRGESFRCEGLTLGYLPQHHHVDRNFPLTVEACVRSGLQARLRWWQRYGAAEREATMCQLRQLGIDHLAQRSIAELSGGQWQRTLLARALVSQPQLLLLDEPDAHLDSQSKAELYETLLAEHAKRAIVVVSHDDELPVPDGGRVVSVCE